MSFVNVISRKLSFVVANFFSNHTRKTICSYSLASISLQAWWNFAKYRHIWRPEINRHKWIQLGYTWLNWRNFHSSLVNWELIFFNRILPIVHLCFLAELIKTLNDEIGKLPFPPCTSRKHFCILKKVTLGINFQSKLYPLENVECEYIIFTVFPVIFTLGCQIGIHAV